MKKAESENGKWLMIMIVKFLYHQMVVGHSDHTQALITATRLAAIDTIKTKVKETIRWKGLFKLKLGAFS